VYNCSKGDFPPYQRKQWDFATICWYDKSKLERGAIVAVLLEVVLDQTYQNQQIINRWNYLGNGVPSSVSMSFALTSALGAIFDEVAVPPGYPPTGLMAIIAGIQHTGVTFNSLTIKDVYSPTDFYSTLFVPNLVGLNSNGNGLSPIDAYGFFTNRIRSDIRRATKRIVGVTEGVVANGGMIEAAFTDEMQGVADAMSATLEYDDSGNTLTFIPCVVKREKYDTSIAPDGGQRTAYRYRSEATQFDFIAEGVVWDYYSSVRSQTSRQYGKGR